MDTTYIFLQHYWWFILALLAGILVFLLFVQGGQAMLYNIGKTASERDVIVNALGRKWELTFTTLVTFGGAFFASFPLFYSTSFSGAIYVWMLILFVFVIQAVAYEYRRKPNNLLGEKTYEYFLMINGWAGALLLGVAVGTLFTGANFTVDRMHITNLGGNTAISQWDTPWRGLEAILDYRNLALGFAVLFLSRVLAILYFMNHVADEAIVKRSHKKLFPNAILFVIFFLLFFISLLFSKGWGVDPQTGVISEISYKYAKNLIAMPIVMILLGSGVVSVLGGMVWGILKSSTKAIWPTGIGTILTVCMLLLLAGFNDTAYYPSLTNMQSSLTIYNSSSSKFTLMVMSYVSLIIPLVFWYIWKVWAMMNKEKISEKEIKSEGGY